MSKETKESFEDFRDFGEIRACYGRTMVLRNTGQVFMMNHSDWLVANICHWFLREDGKVVNLKGTTFEVYCKIIGNRRGDATHYLDLSRYNYE